MTEQFNNPFVLYLQIDTKENTIKTANSLAREWLMNNQALPLAVGNLNTITPLESKTWEQLFLQDQQGVTKSLTIPHRQHLSHCLLFTNPDEKDPENTLNIFIIPNQLSQTTHFQLQLKDEELSAEKKNRMALKLELQMSDIALERKSYELQLIRELIVQIKSLQDYDEIILIFMKFICERFLLGNGFFIKLFLDQDVRGHVSTSFSLLETPPLAGLRQKIYDVILHDSELFTTPKKYWTQDIPPRIADYFQIQDKQLTGILSLPIYFGKNLLGVLQMAHYAPHHGLTNEDVDFIGLLLEQINPFIENSKLFEMSMIDDLTQVFNKRFFKITLEKEFKKAVESDDHCLTLVLLDIDHFKKINDTYGHLAGDKVLQDFAKILKSSVRDKDIVCRYGGEEFAIILTEPMEIGIRMAERIIGKLHNAVIPISQDVNYKITASLGISCLNSKTMSHPDQWVESADQCLYEAKRTGRDKYIVSKGS